MNKAEINAMLVASLGSSKKHMVGSKIGYGAVAYFVRQDKEVIWIAARSRVSPEKIGDTDVRMVAWVHPR